MASKPKETRVPRGGYYHRDQPILTNLSGASDAELLRAVLRGLAGTATNERAAHRVGMCRRSLMHVLYGRYPVSKRAVHHLSYEFTGHRQLRLDQLERDRLQFEERQRYEREALEWSRHQLAELVRRKGL